MKRIVLGILTIAFTVFVGCESDDLLESNSQLNDVQLIAQIQGATKQGIAEDELPALTQEVIELIYDESFVQAAALANDLGYEVELRDNKGFEVGEKNTLYFDLEGRQLSLDDDEKENEGKERFRKGKKDKDCDEKKAKCFDIEFPVSYTMPDGSTIALTTFADWDLIKAWYEANPAVKERAIPVFPIDISYGDGTVVTINNLEEFKEARSKCEKDKKGIERCFELALPVTFTMPDNTSITIQAETDWELIKTWYKANPSATDKPTLNIPFDIVFKDGTTLAINSEQEFDDAFKNQCDKDDDDDDDDDNDPN